MKTQSKKHVQHYWTAAFLSIRGMPRLHAWSSGWEDPLLEIIQGNGQSLQWRASEWQCVSWELLWHTNWGSTHNDFLILTAVNQMRMHSLTLYKHPHYFCSSRKIGTICISNCFAFLVSPFCICFLSSLVYLSFMHVSVPSEIETTPVVRVIIY